MNAAELLPCFARPEGFHHGCRPDDPAQHPHRPAPQPATGELKVDPEIRLQAAKFDLNVSFFYSCQSDKNAVWETLSRDCGGNLRAQNAAGSRTSFADAGEAAPPVSGGRGPGPGANRLTRIEHPDGGKSTYTYAGGFPVDGEGLRRSHHEPGADPVTTIWDGADYLLQKSASATARYVVADGEILAEKRAGSRLVYVPDPLGSVVGLLNTSQAFTDTFAYWP